MKFEALPLSGAYLITLTSHADARGYFMRAYCKEEYKKAGLQSHIAQINHSYSEKKHTLRGFHFQASPYAEAKTISCLQGSIWDVMIDMRSDSPTRFAHFGQTLRAGDGQALHVPTGFAHAFISLEANTLVQYLSSYPYTPHAERGIRWDDPLFSITWPSDNPILSEKDRSWPDFQD